MVLFTTNLYTMIKLSEAWSRTQQPILSWCYSWSKGLRYTTQLFL